MANPKIQLRHDTAANWTSVNPVLLEGEVGIETDTKKFKVGDGVTNWTSLAYGNADTEAIEQLEQDYGSLVDKVDNLEDNAITLDKINTPLEQQNVYGTRTLTTSEGNVVNLDPVYEAKLSYYKMSGVWNYTQVQVALDFGDGKSGDWLIMRNGKQFRLNCNEGQFNNFIYDGVKIATGGAPNWSFEFTSDYNVLITGRDVDDTLIELPEDIKTYLQSIKDNTISTNAIILSNRTATTNITLQTLESINLGLSYDNNTLKVNDSGQLYADVSTEPPANMVTTDTEQTITGAKTFNALTVKQISRATDDGQYQLYDTSMNSTLSGLGMPSTRGYQLTLGVSGSTYEAPANGWFYIDKIATAAGQELNIENKSAGCYTIWSSASNQALRLMMPCSAKSTITITYSAAGNTIWFGFKYAEGEDY